MSAALQPFTARPYGLLVRGVRGGLGPPALLLHGTAGSWRNFRPWLPALLPRRTVIIPDLPGFGDSPAPRGRPRPRLRTWARLVHALLAELAVAPVTVVGLGLGASVALAWLATRQASMPLPAQLVLHTPAYYPGAIRPAFRYGVPLLTAAPLFPPVRGLLAQPRVQDWWLDRLVPSSDAPPADAALLREDLRRVALPVLRALARDLVRADFRPLLRALPVPTLALVAERDPFVDPAAVLALTDLMPDAEVVVQRGSGHGWSDAAINEQNRVLGRFLDRHA